MSILARGIFGTLGTAGSVAWGLGKGMVGGSVASRTLVRGGVGAGIGGTAGAFGEDYNTLTARLQGAGRGALMGAGFGAGSAWTVPILKKAWRGVGARALAKNPEAFGKARIASRQAGARAFRKNLEFGPEEAYRAGSAAQASRMAASQYAAAAKSGLGNWADKAWGMVPKNPKTIAAGLGIGFAATGLGYMGSMASEMTTGRGLTSNAMGAAGADYDMSLPSVNSMMNVGAQYNHQAIAAQEMMSSSLAPTGMVGTGPQMAGPMHNAMRKSTGGLVQGLHRGRHGSA